MTALAPGGPFQQAASLCFTLAGFFSDILLIRIFLFLAYLWLLTSSSIGFPRWPGYTPTGTYSIDGIVWSGINLIVHLAAILRLLWDERPIHFSTDDEDQLARFLYRRGGFEAMEAQEVIRRGEFKKYHAGEVILNAVEATEKVVLLIEGKARFQRKTPGGSLESSNIFLSGMIWDIRLLSIFGVYLGFDKGDVSFEVDALTDCLVFEWTLENLDEISVQCGPSVSSCFRNFLLCQVSLELESRTCGLQFTRNSLAAIEHVDWQQGARSRDFTDPVVVDELPGTWMHAVWVRLGRFASWLWTSFTPTVPAGIRHTGLRGLPRTGLAARRRILALNRAAELKSMRQKSFIRAALERLSSHRG
jgi:hypothetical protein